MTPGQLKNKISIRAAEVASIILTTEAGSTRQAIERKIADVMQDTAIDAITCVLDAYGEFTKVSPAYDRMRSTLAEVKS